MKIIYKIETDTILGSKEKNVLKLNSYSLMGSVFKIKKIYIHVTCEVYLKYWIMISVT